MQAGRTALLAGSLLMAAVLAGLVLASLQHEASLRDHPCLPGAAEQLPFPDTLHTPLPDAAAPPTRPVGARPAQDPSPEA